MTHILFIDPFSQNEYDNTNVESKNRSQDEIYTIMLVNGLSERFFKGGCIYFSQKNRINNVSCGNIEFITIDDSKQLENIGKVIVLKSPSVLLEYESLYNVDSYLLLFDIVERSLLYRMPVDTISLINGKIITLSEWHKKNVDTFLQNKKHIQTLVLPFFVTLFPKDPQEFNIEPLSISEREENTLLFVNNHSRGLSKTIDIFEKLREWLPDLVLKVIKFDNSIHDIDMSNKENIVDLGICDRSEILIHMRKSLCLLHVNEIYPEVFGYSHIEANLLGTPVLCCDHGANKEILVNKGQIVTCKDPYLLKNRIIKMQTKEIPNVYRKINYSKQNVVDQWSVVLGMM